MHRLRCAAAQLQDIINSEHSRELPDLLVESIADELSQKVAVLRKYLLTFQGELSQCSSNGSTLSLLTPPPSSAASLCNESFWEDSLESAKLAFDAEIYARSIRIIDSAAKKGHINVEMIQLACSAYRKMLQELELSPDALKFAIYWAEFAENSLHLAENQDQLNIIRDHFIEALMLGGSVQIFASKLLRLLVSKAKEENIAENLSLLESCVKEYQHILQNAEEMKPALDLLQHPGILSTETNEITEEVFQFCDQQSDSIVMHF